MTTRYNPKNGYPHTRLSFKHKCIVCNKGIKERLIKIKSWIPKLCYKCWKSSVEITQDALHNANQIIRNNH